jgi:hypothetical protein
MMEWFCLLFIRVRGLFQISAAPDFGIMEPTFESVERRIP